MLESIYVIKDNIYFTWFALLVFFFGFCLSYLVNILKIKLLIWFPHQFIKFMSRYVHPKAAFSRIFLIIFLFNSSSILMYMVSGVTIFLPFIIAFITGMNIGLTVFIPPQVTTEGYEIRMIRGAWHTFRMILFSTSVLILEVLTFSIALGMGMSLGAGIASSAGLSGINLSLFISELLVLRIKAYLLICVPILAVSAYMESRVIKGV